jgi:hypothetical protein
MLASGIPMQRSPTRTLQLTWPSVAALLRGHAAERQSLFRQAVSRADLSRRDEPPGFLRTPEFVVAVHGDLAAGDDEPLQRESALSRSGLLTGMSSRGRPGRTCIAALFAARKLAVGGRTVIAMRERPECRVPRDCLGTSAVPVRLVPTPESFGARPGRACIAALFATRKPAVVGPLRRRGTAPADVYSDGLRAHRPSARPIFSTWQSLNPGYSASRLEPQRSE